MAKLKTEQFTFHLMPLEFEIPGEEWIRSDLLLRILVNRQTLLVQPQRTPTLALNDYRRLITSARHFLDFANEDDGDLFGDTESFVFVPAELDFEFSLLDADLSPNGEGEVTVCVMIREDDQPKPVYVGGKFSVEASDVRQFINALEIEIDQIAQQKAALAFVTAEI